MNDVKKVRIADAAAELTVGRTLALIAVAMCVWLCVANFIRLSAPLGIFDGWWGVLTYAITIPLTVRLNRLTRRIVGLPPQKTLAAVAVTLATAPTLEGIVMRCYPPLYGDPVSMAKGAIWLLWAIGIALALAVRTSELAGGRLRAGDVARRIRVKNILGGDVVVPGGKLPLTHVQFLRFAGCPVCNLLLQSYIKRADEIAAAGVREVVFFHSEQRFLADYHAAFPFDVIADPKRIFYSQYKVERSPWAILSPLAWPNLLRGYRLRAAGLPDSSPFGLPAEFLIDADGTIVASHYGAHASDQWSVDDVLRMARVGMKGELVAGLA